MSKGKNISRIQASEVPYIRNPHNAYKVSSDFYLYSGSDSRKSFSGILYPENAPKVVVDKFYRVGEFRDQSQGIENPYIIKIFDKGAEAEAKSHMETVKEEIKKLLSV